MIPHGAVVVGERLQVELVKLETVRELSMDLIYCV